MNNEILVSVVIPVYNSEEFIKRNIESVLNQTYQKFELILVDDGSTDNSKQILTQYAEEDSRINCIFQKNQGAPVARNAGISVSKGDYIYLIDSDDYLAETAFEKMLHSANDTDADIIIGQYDKVNESGIFLNSEDFGYKKGAILTTEHNRKDLSFLPPFPGNKMYKASIIKDNEISFANVKIAQDLNFYLKALLFATSVSIIPDTVYHYRIRFGSISNTFTPKILDVINSIKDVEETYKENNSYDQIFFNNLKFLYCSFQLSKVPQILDMTDRKNTFETLKKEMAKVPDEQLYSEIKEGVYKKNILKMKFGKLFTSNVYHTLQSYKLKKRNKE